MVRSLLATCLNGVLPSPLVVAIALQLSLDLLFQDKLLKTVVANYVLWPAAHFINFKFVPGQHRILYNNCVSVSSSALCCVHAPLC